MDRTIVELTIPFTFLAGGEYLVSVDGRICVIYIYTEKSHELATRIYPGVHFMGSVTSYPADYHGLFEISSGNGVSLSYSADKRRVAISIS
jgi:hypothetical protein